MNLTKSYVQLKPKSVLMLLQFLHENISNVMIIQISFKKSVLINK